MVLQEGNDGYKASDKYDLKILITVLLSEVIPFIS